MADPIGRRPHRPRLFDRLRAVAGVLAISLTVNVLAAISPGRALGAPATPAPRATGIALAEARPVALGGQGGPAALGHAGAPAIARPGAAGRLPVPASLEARRSARASGRAAAAPARFPAAVALRGRFADVDLTAEARQPGAPRAPASAAASAMAAPLPAPILPPLDLRPGRAGRPAAAGGSSEAALPLAPTGEAPWSADRLLANPTNMNDEHVSLAVSPVTGRLYAAFSARDLGSTDRDVHVSRSADGGATWQTVELPSFGEDEYQPDLAIDAAGYLHLVWVRADGVILRVRSAAPDDIAAWGPVRGVTVGDPCATPTIAVSGSGDFARLFIASSWYCFNYDWYAYEWTLLWLHSTNGGLTVTANWLEPDGYPDYWPDAALDGGTCFLVNGEEDPYSGQVEILLAADALSGGFAEVVSLSDWTPMSCGFPSLAAYGASVHCAFQLDWDDGTGAIDGDVIYWRSRDGLASVEGPFGMVADERESLGPAIHVRDGLVGCTWLDAAAGADELRLAGSLCGLDGDPSYWTAIEAISDLPYVEPVFHAAAGVATGAAATARRVHAAWIDRRDYTAAGLNVYTADRVARCDLAPFQPSGWGAALVASPLPGGRTTAPLPAGGPAYVSFALANLGLAAATRSFLVRLTLDGATVAEWSVDAGLGAGTYVAVEDHAIAAGAGDHILALAIDPVAGVAEEDEANNAASETITCVTSGPRLRLGTDLVEVRFPAPGAPAKGAVLAALAAEPPLARRPAGPVVEARLAARLAAAGSQERLRVVIEPRERVDAAALGRALGPGRDKARRTAVLTAVRDHAAAFGLRLRASTAGLVGRGRMSSPEVLWLTGAAVAEVTPEAAAALAADPAVGRLWLDDRRSEPFGGRDGAAGAAGAPGVPARGDAASAAAVAWHLQQIGADVAWAAGRDGTGVIVGHTDTGVAYDHPDLAAGMWDGGPAYPHHGWDCLDEDDDPYDGETGIWHGTHTAGLVIGDGAGGQRTGAAPGAKLMALRCVPGYWQDLAEALQFSLDHGADLVTTSAGWAGAGDALREACRDAAEVLLAAGVPWICAAGNGDNAGGHYAVPVDIATPGDCPHPWHGAGGHSAVIAVGATDAADQTWNWGSIGPTAWALAAETGHGDYPYPPGLAKPDLAAPGSSVASTVPGGYAVYSGTSMATPLVAGACAILLQASPGLGLADLARILEQTAVDVGAAGRDPRAGAGRLDIPSALAALGSSVSLPFGVHDDGLLPLTFTATWSAPWLSLAPAGGTIAAGDSLRVVAVLDPAGLPVGLYQDEIVFASNEAAGPHRLPVRMIVGDLTAVEGPPPTASAAALRSHPNPFNPATTLRFELALGGPVELVVCDARGRLVRRLLAAALPAGRHEAAWDGRDERGRLLPSGVYLARLTGPDGRRSAGKLTLVR